MEILSCKGGVGVFLKISNPIRTKTGRRLFLLLLCSLFSFQSANSRAYDVSKENLQAALLYKFIKFIDWPCSTFEQSPDFITIGVYGDGRLYESITKLGGKQIRGRTLVVKKFHRLDNIEFTHILFISPSKRDNLKRVLNKIGDNNTITVSSYEGFAATGGVINFITIKNKLTFEINPSAARRAGITISSKLLELARIVKDENP